MLMLHLVAKKQLSIAINCVSYVFQGFLFYISLYILLANSFKIAAVEVSSSIVAVISSRPAV